MYYIQDCPKIYRKNGKIYSCCSHSCTSQGCRQYWSLYEALKLQNEVESDPIEWYCTLKFQGIRPTQPQFMKSWRKLNQAILYEMKKRKIKHPEMEWRMKHYLDCTGGEGCDHNLIINTNNAFINWRSVKRWFRPLLQKAFNGFTFRLYTRVPLTQIGLAAYVCGWITYKNKRHLPPTDWRHKRLVLGMRKTSPKTGLNKSVMEYSHVTLPHSLSEVEHQLSDSVVGVIESLNESNDKPAKPESKRKNKKMSKYFNNANSNNNRRLDW